MNWPFANQIGVGSGLALLLLIIIEWIAYRSTTELLEIAHRPARSHGVLEKLKAVLFQLRDAEAAQRCHLIPGKTPPTYSGRVGPMKSGVAQDITERKRAEQKIKERTVYLHALIENSPLAIVVHDAQCRIQMCNPAFERLFLYRQAEVVGASLDDLVATKEIMPEANEITRRTLAGESVRITTRRRRKDGSLVDVELHAVPLVVDGQLVGGYGLYHDITERKRAEQALRESEERYRELFENANDIVGFMDLAGNVTSLNKAGERILGYAGDEALTLNVAQLVAPEHRELMRRNITRNLAGEGPTNYELEALAKGGRRVALEVSPRPICQHGQPVGWQAIARDVTERKQLEDQLRQAQKMEAVGQLAGGVSHDFNNLLMVIRGYSELLLDRLGPGDPLRRHAEQIQKATDRAASLTRQLLAFSRKQVLQPRLLDLNAVVADMEKLLRRLIGEDIDLVIVRDPALGRVKADPGQIEQVILNLAVNARDAMPQGGKLAIETGNVELDDAYIRRHAGVAPGHYVLLAVTDTGCGMDAETQAHIFEPFFTTKEKGKGTGLGLATTYGVVRQSGGFVWVYSERGQGSTFKIYLPLAEQPPEATEPGKALAGPPRGSETVLLAEDEEAVRELAREFLELSGYTVLAARNGAEAVQLSARHPGPIHLLVTDVVMPGTSGRELAARLVLLRPNLKVLYVSGYPGNSIVHHGILDPGTVLLPKPFTRAALASKVRALLDESEREPQLAGGPG